jgi:hypothetical protein
MPNRNRAGYKLSVYRLDRTSPTYHIRDEHGMKLIAYRHPATRRFVIKAVIKNSKKYYGRINYNTATRVRSRTSSQELLKSRFESATYSKCPTNVLATHPVRYVAPPARRHTVVMNAETLNLVGAARSATEYARGARVIDLPRVPRGINFEWCHLIGHGLGGADAVGNLVAGTKECNSEQLIIENVIWSYRNEQTASISICVNASVRGSNLTKHVGGVIRYRIFGHNELIFEHYIDCFRATKPNGEAEGIFSCKVYEAINGYLRTQYPASDEEIDSIEEAVDSF